MYKRLEENVFWKLVLLFKWELIQIIHMASGMQEVRLDDQDGPFWPYF